MDNTTFYDGIPSEEVPVLEEAPVIIQSGGSVDSVNGQTGDVVLTAEDVGATSQEEFHSKVTEIESAIGDVESSVTDEIADREAADNNLQSQIDAISASSDVTDIVGTYAELQAYDTTTLSDKDIIKVLQDETQNDETTYYRWSATTQTFTLIGEEGPYYTKAAADAKFVDQTDYAGDIADIEAEIAGKQDTLTAGSNITIDANNEISATDTTYSDFTGTDGTTAGTSGLVPAPATTDAGKFLKSDGTWDTASGGGGTLYSTIGQNTDGAMTQKATTDMVYPLYSTNGTQRIVLGSGETFGGADSYHNSQIVIGSYNKKTNAGGAITIGDGINNYGSIAIGSLHGTYQDPSGNLMRISARSTYMGYIGNYTNSETIGQDSTLVGYWNNGFTIESGASGTLNSATLYGVDSQVSTSASLPTAIGQNSKVQAGTTAAVALGYGSNATRSYEVSVGSGAATNGTRFVANVTDPQLAQDAATKNYVDNLIASLEARIAALEGN